MAPSTRLFLIRHGETVDNVAGLYAGIRDSELTNHGYQQATRLGLHFKAMELSFTRIFSSHLQRAWKTANKIREAQLGPAGHNQAAIEADVPEVVQLALLVEQNFGSMEGKKFSQPPSEPRLASKEHHSLESKDTRGFVAVESKDAMARRADTFLDEHLLPLLGETLRAGEECIAIVSHGIFLSTLWKRLLLRLPAKSVAMSSELQTTARPSLEHLGGWSNTGYLELHMMPTAAEPLPSAPNSSSRSAEMRTQDEVLGESRHIDNTKLVNKSAVSRSSPTEVETPKPSTPRIAYGWRTTIMTINGKDHLKGLKRTGGGVGSSRHDASQKSIETFFKRQKLG